MMVVDEHQFLGNQITNLFFCFFCLVHFQSLLVQKHFKIVSLELFSQMELQLEY